MLDFKLAARCAAITDEPLELPEGTTVALYTYNGYAGLGPDAAATASAALRRPDAAPPCRTDLRGPGCEMKLEYGQGDGLFIWSGASWVLVGEPRRLSAALARIAALHRGPRMLHWLVRMPR